MSDELVQKIKMGVRKPVGIQGARAAAEAALKNLNPNTVESRFVIGFDDSGSMSGNPIQEAKKAVSAFLNACPPQTTSVGVYPFNEKPQPLTCQYDLVNMYLGSVRATGGTPLYTTMSNILDSENLTRGILFSDGEPTDDHIEDVLDELEEDGTHKRRYRSDVVIDKAIAKKIPFDTVYIGAGDSKILQDIAKRTGGVYLRFDDASVFAKQMKYLSPKYYALLSNPELKARIERGETI
jgi:Mg-chelatase subunit ChlD